MDETTKARQSQDKRMDIDQHEEKTLATTKTDFAALGNIAEAGTHIEHTMTLREAVRRYPKAIGWSVLLSLAVAMEGYGKCDCQESSCA